MQRSSAPWPCRKQDYELYDEIGHGGTAVVYSAWCHPLGKMCAIKRTKLYDRNCVTLTELEMMAYCHHKNVTQYHAAFVVDEEVWIVMRLFNLGSLWHAIDRRKKAFDCRKGIFDVVTIATLLLEVVKGLSYLHQNKIIHRDIKAQNILLDDDGSVQVTDFGLSTWFASASMNSRHRTIAGTMYAMAPEVINPPPNGYDHKADIWSFGILAIELTTGRPPYHKLPAAQVLKLTVLNDPPTLDTGAEELYQFSSYGEDLRELIDQCLQKDPTNRPTALQLLENRFFRQAEDRKYLRRSFRMERNLVEWCGTQSQRTWISSSPGTTIDADIQWTWPSDEDGATHIATECYPTVLELLLTYKDGRMVFFKFRVGHDSPVDVAYKLIANGSLSGYDMDPFASGLQELIENRRTMQSLNFRMLSASYHDDDLLIGWAEICIVA